MMRKPSLSAGVVLGALIALLFEKLAGDLERLFPGVVAPRPPAPTPARPGRRRSSGKRLVVEVLAGAVVVSLVGIGVYLAIAPAADPSALALEL
jgi:hypothetical protein